MPATEADRPEETVKKYYESLREGEPLEVYFADAGSTFKFGVGERLFGYDEVKKRCANRPATPRTGRSKATTYA